MNLYRKARPSRSSVGKSLGYAPPFPCDPEQAVYFDVPLANIKNCLVLLKCLFTFRDRPEIRGVDRSFG